MTERRGGRPLQRAQRLAIATRRLFLAGAPAAAGKRANVGADQLNDDARRVLGAHALFCNVDKPLLPLDGNGRIDQAAMLIGEGRRQAFLHLTAALKLTDLGLQRLAQLAREGD